MNSPSTGPTKKAEVTLGDQGKEFAGRGGVAFHQNLLQLRLRGVLGRRLRLRTLVSAKPAVSGVRFFWALIWPTGIAGILMFALLHTPIVAIVVGQEVEYPTVLGHISNVNVIS